MKNKKDLEGKLESGLTSLIDSRILEMGNKSRKAFLKEMEENQTIEGFNANTANSWINGRKQFPPTNLKQFVDILEIPYEDLIQVHIKPDNENLTHGRIEEFRQVFQEGLEENEKQRLQERIMKSYGRDYSKLTQEELDSFKDQGEKSIEELIKWYVDLKTGKSLKAYCGELEENKTIEGFNAGTARNWICGINPFPQIKLKQIVDLLEIPYEELIQVYIKPDNKNLTPGRIEEFRQVFQEGLEENEKQRLQEMIIESYGRDYSKPTQEELDLFKDQGKKCIGELIKWYVDLKTGKQLQTYLKELEKNKTIEGFNACTANNWIKGKYTFPPIKLKQLVDNLEISYEEVNQFLDYDIDEAKEPVIINDEYIEKTVFEASNVDAIKTVYGMVKGLELGMDEQISSCLSDIIAFYDKRLLNKKYKISQKLSQYLRQSSNGTNEFNTDPSLMVEALEDIMKGYVMLSNPPNNVFSTLVEITKRVYEKRYEEEVSISSKIENDLKKVDSETMKGVLLETKKFFDFIETPLLEVYEKDVYDYIQTIELRTT